MMFSILAQSLPKKASVQGVGTFVVLLLTLFGGFIVNPKSYVLSMCSLVASFISYKQPDVDADAALFYLAYLNIICGYIGLVLCRGLYKAWCQLSSLLVNTTAKATFSYHLADFKLVENGLRIHSRT